MKVERRSWLCRHPVGLMIYWPHGRPADAKPTKKEYRGPYIFRWDRCGRKGKLCRVVASGARNSIAVVFPEDGWMMITSGNAIRRAP